MSSTSQLKRRPKSLNTILLENAARKRRGVTSLPSGKPFGTTASEKAKAKPIKKAPVKKAAPKRKPTKKNKKIDPRKGRLMFAKR